MSFEFGHHRRHLPEPDLVPILDGLTSVIFFLLLSATFIEYTKLTLPPSQTSVGASTSNEDPLAPKILVRNLGDKVRLQLSWGGAKPSSKSKTVERPDREKKSTEFEVAIKEMSEDFIKVYPSEKAIQVGLSKDASYQDMITVMDGVRKSFENVVLIGPEEANSL